MTTIISPSGEAVGTTFSTPEEYAARARRVGWTAFVMGERVYLHLNSKLEQKVEQAERQANG